MLAISVLFHLLFFCLLCLNCSFEIRLSPNTPRKRANEIKPLLNWLVRCEFKKILQEEELNVCFLKKGLLLVYYSVHIVHSSVFPANNTGPQISTFAQAVHKRLFYYARKAGESQACSLRKIRDHKQRQRQRKHHKSAYLIRKGKKTPMVCMHCTCVSHFDAFRCRPRQDNDVK